ncbi:fatty acid synthase [Trichonephila inaurata madagascariensis]|uniref:Fatty acid synthase n=1 Tax=Trichonephila inaurata madagascariensis TaxID=2747483 RepID=A0A8X6YPD2_9ARAC|nr:fatty acid synthase [Trichonephila inaurata madagascariensis]
MGDSKRTTFAVYITYIERKFEISEGGSVVCTGRVNVLNETKHKDSTQCFKDEDMKNLSLDASDVYKELRLRGYEYGPKFQGIIGADVEGNRGLLKWTGQWVAFLDSLLQLTVLSYQERALCLPTRIKKVTIDPEFHKAYMTKSLTKYQENNASRKAENCIGSPIVLGYSVHEINSPENCVNVNYAIALSLQSRANGQENCLTFCKMSKTESVKSYQDSVIRIEVGKYEKWVPELRKKRLQDSMSSEGSEKNMVSVYLLVRQLLPYHNLIPNSSSTKK